jgi:KDO2-lipid IV(A) lauroyltransferase
MGFLLDVLVRTLVAILQALPLDFVARIGRAAGGIAWGLDRRHRSASLENLKRALGSELSSQELHAIARENFRRIGENYASAVKIAAMSDAELAQRIEVIGFDAALPPPGTLSVIAVGHFGNFEVLARLQPLARGRRLVTTYRALRPPALDAALQRLRNQSGILYFERTRDGARLRSALSKGEISFGLLCDQHAGNRGLWLPFFGHPCSTSAAPAVYALRFEAKLAVAICYRTRMAHWRVEFSDAIPVRLPDGSRRGPAEIMSDVNQHLEAAVRRDPANWFWVHRRWKPPSPLQATGRGQAPGDEESTPGLD